MKCRGCAAVVKDHKWAKIRAHSEGWFFTKDETAYCPDHVPQHLKEWRERQSRT